MARPKLGEGDTQRLQLKISDEELAAIDDWRFANRVNSRSEAVRRLCQMALIIDREFETVVDTSIEVSDFSEKIWSNAREANWALRDADPSKPTPQVIRDYINDTLENAYRISKVVEHLKVLLVGLWNASAPLADVKDIGEAFSSSEDVLIETGKLLHEMADQQERYADNQRLAFALSEMSDAEKAAYEVMTEDEKDAYLERAIAKLRLQEEDAKMKGTAE